ncbi:hypothetical protein ABSA28_00911 [Candidatus Hepatincolaceae symbiont of Richtersius coronifer]
MEKLKISLLEKICQELRSTTTLVKLYKFLCENKAELLTNCINIEEIFNHVMENKGSSKE